MGVYDHIRCEYLLPDAEVQEETFQTKSLPDPWLHDFTITRDGRLILHVDRKFDGKYKLSAKHFELEGFAHFGVCKVLPSGDVEIPYDGILLFYKSLGQYPDDQWYEYAAKFTDGRLQELKRVPEKSSQDASDG